MPLCQPGVRESAAVQLQLGRSSPRRAPRPLLPQLPHHPTLIVSISVVVYNPMEVAAVASLGRLCQPDRPWPLGFHPSPRMAPVF